MPEGLIVSVMVELSNASHKGSSSVGCQSNCLPLPLGRISLV